MADLLHDPAAPTALDLSMINPSLLTSIPERLLALAADLLLWGDWTRGGECLDLLERTQPAIPRDSRLAFRLAVVQALRCALHGEAAEVVRHARTAQSIEDRTHLGDEWGFGVPVLLLRGYTWLEDFEAVDRAAAAAQTMSSVTESGRLVDVRGAQALAWFEAGDLNRAAEAAHRADVDARRLGFEQHPFAVDYLRVLPESRWSNKTSTRPSSSPSAHSRYLNVSGRSSSSARCLTGAGSGRHAGTLTMR